MVVACMSAQSMGLQVFANEIQDTYIAKTNSSKTQEEILTDALLEAQDVLKSKKALLEEALLELNSVKPDYESKQLVYTNSNAYTSNTQRIVNDAVLDSMKSNLLDIQNTKEELNVALEDKTQAKQDANRAEESFNQAQKALEIAQKAYDEAVLNAGGSNNQQKLEDAKKDVEKATNAYNLALTKQKELDRTIRANEMSLNSLKTQQEDVENTMSTKQGELSELQSQLKILQDSIQNDTTEDAVSQKQQSINQYQNEIESLTVVVSQYDSEISSLKNQIAQLEKQFEEDKANISLVEIEVNQAKSVLDAKTKEAQAAKDAYNKAGIAVENQKKENQRLQAIVDETKKNLEEAKKTYDQSLSSLDSLKANVLKAQAEVDGLKDAYNEALNTWDEGSYGYFKSIHADYALSLMDDERLNQKDNFWGCILGADSDPTNLNNMIETIDYIRKCNELRKQNGLNELKVDLSLVAMAQINAIGNINQLENPSQWGQWGHLAIFNCGENIAYGPKYYDPFIGWYNKEYKLLQDAIASGKYTGLENMTSKEVHSTWPELWKKIGHYYNILDDRYNYTGYALGQTVIVNPGCLDHSQTFMFTSSDLTMTVDEYEKSLKDYVGKIQKVFDAYEGAKEKLAQAQKALSDAQTTSENYINLQKAQQSYDMANANVAASLESTKAFEQEMKSKKKAYDVAVSEKTNAKTDYDRTIEKKQALLDAVQELNGQIDDLNKKILMKTQLKSETSQKIGGLDSNVQILKNEISTLKTNKEKLLESEKQVSLRVKNKQSELQDLKDTSKELEQKVNSTKSAIDVTEKELNNQLSVVESKKQVLNNAKDTYDALLCLDADVKNSYTLLEKTKTEYEDAQNKQNEMHARVVECSEKVNTIQNKLSGLNADQLELEKLQMVFEHLQKKELNTQIPESKYNEITNALTTYKKALMDLDVSQSAYEEVKVVYSEKQDAYNKAKQAYEEAVVKEKEAQDQLNAYLQEQENKKQGFWISDKNGWWYKHQDGSYTKNNFEVIKGQTFYFDSNGYMITGWKQVGKDWYYFTTVGNMAKNQWINNYYFEADGKMATNKWIGKYYVDSNGRYTPDKWVLTNGKYWYRHQDGSYTKSDFEVINGQTYYFDGNGYMVTGWQKINDKDYYFNESGAMVTDAWVGNYYLQQDGSMAINTWIGNYYVDSNGLWTPDQWIVSNGKYWYRHQDGSYTINDFEVINDLTYYFDGNGYMVTGWQKINNKDYYFNESGAMATNTWIGNYHVGADGKWDLTR